MTAPAISICICTFNRCESLRHTLDSLVRQTDVDMTGIEVLIVDNNCTDATPNVVEAFHHLLPIQRLIERRQGLAHARNRGLAEFSGDVLLFTDDDVILTPSWLAAYRDAILRFPAADYFGGRILPDWRGTQPRWIGERPLHLLDGLLGWFDYGSETRPFLPGEPLPFGASFGISRDLSRKNGSFAVHLGIGGNGTGRGEETEFLARARAARAQGIYVGQAICFHAYDRRRVTMAALFRHGIACGRSFNAIASRPHKGKHRTAAWYILRGLYQALKGHGDRFRQCVINAGIEVGCNFPAKVSDGPNIRNRKLWRLGG